MDICLWSLGDETCKVLKNSENGDCMDGVSATLENNMCTVRIYLYRNIHQGETFESYAGASSSVFTNQNTLIDIKVLKRWV